MKSKLFTFLLTLTMSIGTISAESGTCGENLTWDFTDGVLTISGIGDMFDYAWMVDCDGGGCHSGSSAPWNGFRSAIQTLMINDGVTHIGNLAFYGCTGLTSIEIPTSVISIRSSAFYGCTGLTSIEIPNSVTSIGGNAFGNCTGLTSVTIGNGVSDLGDDAFSGCTSLPVENNLRYADTYLVGAIDRSLSSYTIKEGTKWIGAAAFWNCTGLTSIEIPNSVTSIGTDAFNNCTSLTSIEIPNSVKSMGDYAFSGCDHLTSIVYNAHVFAFMPRSYYGVYTIPDGIESIVGSAFGNCTGLTSIDIPNSVTSIGGHAFHGCTSLTSIDIPNSVTSIGEGAFYCTSLTSIKIPNSVMNIGYGAFWNCTGLTSVTIEAETPATIGERVFEGDALLHSVFVPCGSMDNYQSADKWSKYASIMKYLPLDYNIYTHSNNGTVRIPTSVCDSLTAIPDYGYHFIRWSDGNTDNPRMIELTQDTTIIAEFAIDKKGSCGKDNTLNWSYEDKSKTLTITGDGDLTENYTFGIEAPMQMKTLVISNDVTSIGDSAFYGMTTINHLSIGSNVASIGNYAFAECKNFDDITCYATIVPTINETTFSNVGNKQYIYLYVLENRQRAYLRDTYWGEFDVQVKNAETITEPVETVVVIPSDNTAEISWPVVDGAESYEIAITKDGEIVCTLIFNANGQLIGITFAPARDKANKQQTEGFKFTVTGLASATQYSYTIAAKNENQIVDTKSGSFTTTDGAQGIENVLYNSSAKKIVDNNNIYILMPNGKKYSIIGKLVK